MYELRPFIAVQSLLDAGLATEDQSAIKVVFNSDIHLALTTREAMKPDQAPKFKTLEELVDYLRQVIPQARRIADEIPAPIQMGTRITFRGREDELQQFAKLLNDYLSLCESGEERHHRFFASQRCPALA